MPLLRPFVLLLALVQSAVLLAVPLRAQVVPGSERSGGSARGLTGPEPAPPHEHPLLASRDRAPAPRQVRAHGVPRPAAPASGPLARLQAAVARIPSYRPGEAHWVLRAYLGHWGAADVPHRTLYVSPWVPPSRLYDVVVHEWAHLRSVEAYGGQLAVAVRAMDAFYGGTGFQGAERAADCMARLAGADWTHYTSCPSQRWRDGARRLLAGLPL